MVVFVVVVVGVKVVEAGKLERRVRKEPTRGQRGRVSLLPRVVVASISSHARLQVSSVVCWHEGVQSDEGECLRRSTGF